MKPSEIFALLVEGNMHFTASHAGKYFESFKSGQNPFITLVTCSDSRVPLNVLLPDTSNNIFTIKNIGNQILSTEGSVDYGIYHLKTPFLLFLGHSDCGAIRAYLRGFDQEVGGIKHELDFLKPIIKKYDTKDHFEELHSHIIEKNLDYQVNVAYKKYRDLVNAEKLTIAAAYYDFRAEFGRGYGKIVFTNVNRKKSVKELQNLPVFSGLSPMQKNIYIGRLEE